MQIEEGLKHWRLKDRGPCKMQNKNKALPSLEEIEKLKRREGGLLQGVSNLNVCKRPAGERELTGR